MIRRYQPDGETVKFHMDIPGEECEEVVFEQKEQGKHNIQLHCTNGWIKSTLERKSKGFDNPNESARLRKRKEQ